MQTTQQKTQAERRLSWLYNVSYTRNDYDTIRHMVMPIHNKYEQYTNYELYVQCTLYILSTWNIINDSMKYEWTGGFLLFVQMVSKSLVFGLWSCIRKINFINRKVGPPKSKRKKPKMILCPYILYSIFSFYDMMLDEYSLHCT